MNAYPRTAIDLDAYIRRIQNSPCFICELVAGRLGGNHVIYQDERWIAFLNKYPTLYGYCLAAPVAHKEQVCSDFSLEEYLELQQGIYHLTEAIHSLLAPERIYILSLGSQQGNRHVHWHIAPLPPGVPFMEQQLEALHPGRGVLQIPEPEMAALAEKFREALLVQMRR